MGKGVMLWLKVYADLPDNPKSIRLGALLEENNAHVYPLNLWCWATRQAPDGIIRAPTAAALPRMVEEAARWRGPPGLLFKALLGVGWLDALERPVKRVAIHDWDAINGAHQRAAEKGADRVRKHRANKKLALLRGGLDPLGAEGQPPEFAGHSSDETVTKPVSYPLRNASVTDERVYKPPMREPRAAQAAVSGMKRPVVVAGRRKKKSPPKSSRTTTTNGLWVRNEDLARDLFAELVASLRANGKQYLAEQMGQRVYPLRIDGDVLELGAPDEYAISWFSEHAELLALERLQAVDESMKLRVVISQRPPAPQPPTSWRLDECLLWLERAGLSMAPRPTDENLTHFWDLAEDVPPADLLAAAEKFRSDEYWAKDSWAVFRFICDGVWKIRIPARQSVAPVNGSR